MADGPQTACVIGYPIEHSLSPTIHNAAFAAAGLDWHLFSLAVPAGEAPDAIRAMRARGLAGLSVTMPHKEVVGGLVDSRSADASLLNAVNCVAWENDHLVGHNTDGAGFLDSLRLDHGFDPSGARAVVLGAGGAARAVILALAQAGVADLVVVNRTRERAEVAAALAGPVGRVGTAEIADADLIVNATSVGMGDDSLPCDPEPLHDGQVVADLVYLPEITPLLAAAAERGATAITGVGMLVHQAAHAFQRWTGVDAPREVMATAARAELARRAAQPAS